MTKLTLCGEEGDRRAIAVRKGNGFGADLRRLLAVPTSLLYNLLPLLFKAKVVEREKSTLFYMIIYVAIFLKKFLFGG